MCKSDRRVSIYLHCMIKCVTNCAIVIRSSGARPFLYMHQEPAPLFFPLALSTANQTCQADDERICASVAKTLVCSTAWRSGLGHESCRDAIRFHARHSEPSGIHLYILSSTCSVILRRDRAGASGERLHLSCYRLCIWTTRAQAASPCQQAGQCSNAQSY